jgi:hypothetical protein
MRLFSRKNHKSQQRGPALGFGSANLRKNRGPQERRSALRLLARTPAGAGLSFYDTLETRYVKHKYEATL